MRVRLPEKRTTVFTVMVTVVCIDLVTAFSPLEDELPIDATGAFAYYNDGIIDSTLLERLLQLYRRPLQVPAGEVVELLEVFPELSGYLPEDESHLVQYCPWDRAAQKRFLADYPVLQRLRPVLQFDYHTTKFQSTASFFMNNPVNGTPAKHSSRFSIAPTRKVKLRGTVDATADYARWERRVLSVRPVAWTQLQLGNFTMTADRGLFFGYFPDDSATEHTIGNNWLYGSAASWNGAAASVTPPEMVLPHDWTSSLSGFVHNRPTETATGVWAGVTGKGKTGVSCGVSRLTATGERMGETYLHTTVTVARKIITTELHCGVAMSEENIQVPFIWNSTIATGAGGQRTRLTVARLPKGFSAPRSALLQRFSREFDMPDTLQSSIIMARVHSTISTGRPVRIAPRCELWFENGNIHHGTLQLRGDLHRKIAEGSLLFSLSFPGAIGSTSNASMQGTFSWKPLTALSVSTFHRYRISKTGRWRYRGTLSPEVLLFSHLRIQPTISGTLQSGHFPQYLAGVRQNLLLFDRTRTEFYVEQDLSEIDSGDHLRIEGRASFYF